MTFHFKELNESNHQELLLLAQHTDTGSDLFYVDRSPAFFRLSEEFGYTRHFGLFKGEDLIGSVAISQHKRVIGGACEKVFYLNDLRVHPDYQGSFAFYRLVENVITLYKSEGTVKWMFSTVLDSNSHKGSITNGNRVIPKGSEIGRSVHVGVPMFIKQRKGTHSISDIGGEEAWQIYRKFAKAKQFAPCEKDLFVKENGVFLMVRDNGNNALAVCKLVDQSYARKLRLSKNLPLTLKLVDIFCRVAGCPPFPKKGEEFKHGYIAFYCAEQSNKYVKELVAYIQKQYKNKFSYLFFGMSVEEAKKWRGNPFSIMITSTTYAYGDVPQNLSMDCHELTLI
ncbi:GNAT family N-acetyltransferase [Ferdinandcohnia sp. Marseille-Q9671]